MANKTQTLDEKQAWMRERNAPAEPVATSAPGGAFERHYLPREIAELWGFDESTVRRLFQDEPGVLRIGKQENTNGRRGYVSIRIPASVAERMYRELSR